MDLPALPDDLDELRRQAWIGDAVLSLVVRGWILERHGRMSSRMFENLTSNAFLSSLGNPTRVEALIGALFERDGLEGASAYIRAVILPQFERQERNRRRH